MHRCRLRHLWRERERERIEVDFGTISLSLLAKERENGLILVEFVWVPSLIML